MKIFLLEKNYPIDHFGDHDFINDFAFLVDMTDKLNTLNMKLQGQDMLISDQYHCVATFQTDLELIMQQMEKGETPHFPTLSKRVGIDHSRYLEKLENLNIEFLDRFGDFKKYVDKIVLFSHPRLAEPIDMPIPLQRELISLKTDPITMECFRIESDLSILQSYTRLPKATYPNLKEHGMKFLSMFGSTYLCESLFSRMTYVKNKYQTRLTDSHLCDILRTSVTNLRPRLKEIAAKSQCQISH
ncbi:general transcription factor II-I repeat domain-containing protein 2-like [Watersipora subatra]|uniref:general transcription factor II-I repeat domain-containing protein 2-like n=1 Tax=Watersipora subatra TaxID=2589382 RepID=UPI00355C1BBB